MTRAALDHRTLRDCVAALATALGLPRSTPAVDSTTSAVGELLDGVRAALTIHGGARSAAMALGRAFTSALEELPIATQEQVIAELRLTSADAIVSRQLAAAHQAEANALRQKLLGRPTSSSANRPVALALEDDPVAFARASAWGGAIR